MKSMTTWFAAAVLCLAACDSSIAPDKEDDGHPSEEESGVGGHVVIDATADGRWVYFDLGSGKVVAPAKPEASKGWDVAFKRFHVALNGGVSGTGGAEAALVKNVEFDAVTEAPTSGYASDVADSRADKDEEPDYFISSGETGWWDYDPMTHILTPHKHVYVVHGADGAFYKLAILDYYNDAGSSGYLSIRFELLSGTPGNGDGDGDGDVDGDGDGNGDAGAPDAGEEPDAGPVDYETITVSATSNEEWVHVKVGEGTVTIADPETSSDWDFAFQRTKVRTNSGTSGPGQGGARLLEGPFSPLTVVPTTEGFEIDEIIMLSGAGGATEEFSGNPVLNGWYDYDLGTHQLTPKPIAFLLRTANGGYAKLRIATWSGGMYTLDVGALDE